MKRKYPRNRRPNKRNKKKDDSTKGISKISNEKMRRMKDEVVGDKVHEIYLQITLTNSILSAKLLNGDKPITNQYMLRNHPQRVIKLWHAYLSSNFYALPHEGMNYKDLILEYFPEELFKVRKRREQQQRQQ